MRRITLLGAVLGAVLSVPAVFFVAFEFLYAMVQEEYRTRGRISSDGDNVMIPAAGITLAWVLLVTVVGIAVSVVLLRRSKRRAALSTSKHAASPWSQ